MILELGKKYKLIGIQTPRVNIKRHNNIYLVTSIRKSEITNLVCAYGTNLDNNTYENYMGQIDDAINSIDWELVPEIILVSKSRFELIAESD